MIKSSLVTKLIRKFGIYFLILLALTTLVVLFRPEVTPFVRLQSLIFLTISYLAWAFVYHIVDKTISLEIVIEYLLTASLALVILYSILI